MDNGWNSELAQNNISALLEPLSIDLHTHVIDWSEYRSLMQAFFDADVVDVAAVGGGVNSGKSAYEKIIAGASLLQLYTSFVYRGPSAAKDIKKELIQILKSEGISNIKDVIGKNS